MRPETTETGADALLTRMQAWARERRERVRYCGNEQKTKEILISPYIRMLGFDVSDPHQVEVEYQTGVGKGFERVDYAILENGEPVILIEAKPANFALPGGAPTQQIKRCAIDQPSVRFAALTNGTAWAWYYKDDNLRLADKPFLMAKALRPGKADARLLAKITNYPKHPETLQACKDKLLATQFEEWIEGALEAPSDDLVNLAFNELRFNRHDHRQVPPEALRRGFKQASRQFRRPRVQHSRKQAEQSAEGLLEAHAPRNAPGRKRRLGGLRPNLEAQAIKSSPASLRCSLKWTGETGPKEFTNATLLLLDVVKSCAQRHRGGETAYLRLLSETPYSPGSQYMAVISQKAFEADQSLHKKYSSPRALHEYRVFMHLSNTAKIEFISRLLSRCVLLSGPPLRLGRDLTVKLPNAA